MSGRKEYRIGAELIYGGMRWKTSYLIVSVFLYEVWEVGSFVESEREVVGLEA